MLIIFFLFFHADHSYTSLRLQFEDENFALGGVLPAASTVGIYKGLQYNAFVGVDNTLNDGVQPHSPPNEVVTGLPQSLTNGTAFIAAAGSTTYFDFKSFYFGCTVDTATALVSVPKSCVLTATGFYQGKQHIVQEFKYTPDNFLVAGQKSAKTSYSKCHTGFMGVDKVEFTTDDPTLDILILDDITYIPHTCT